MNTQMNLSDPLPITSEEPIRHMESVVATIGLTKQFGTDRAVDDLSLTVNQGDIYGFLGLNGAGKTTTLRLLLGLLRPTAGSIALFGDSSRNGLRAGRSRIGAMVEGPAFFGALSGAANLRLLAGLNQPVPRARVEEVLEIVGLKSAGRKPFRAYSLGMKQRLGIAMALIGSPELVILDEPTNGLDPNGIHEMRSLIHRLNASEGATFIISSHLLHEIEMVCSKVAIIEHGRLIVEDRMENLIGGTDRHVLCATPTTVATHIIEESTGKRPTETADGLSFEMQTDRLPDLVRSLAAAGVDVRALTENRRTLEDFFLDHSRTSSEGSLS